MRIISGIARGRRLRSPASARVRPTEDRVREAIFSVIGSVEGAVVVDGFAGSGALGLEALSRGAGEAYFFDISHQAIEVINENIARVGVGDRARVFKQSFLRGLEDLVEGTPDLWFLDPPYDRGLVVQSLEAMAKAEDRVTKGALVVVEAADGEEIVDVGGFVIEDRRRYGSTQVIFLRRL